jgi:ABC-type multidrug transport system ATPase subunit
MSAIVLCNVVKGFGKKRVLDRLDVTIPEGRVTVMMGANGAGKSTLLRCLLGVLAPGEGSVLVLGLVPLVAWRVIRVRMGFVPVVPDDEPLMTAAMIFDFV